MPSRSQTLNKHALRRWYRAQRRDLPPQERLHAALAIANSIIQLPEYQKAQHIAVYSALPEEIPLEAFVQLSRQDNKSLYLPVVDPDNHLNKMHFRLWTSQDAMEQNQLGISEPQYSDPSHKEVTLDLVLMPTVAFDNEGHRLGMGGGYYDRYFSKLNSITTKIPMRIGIAHSCQFNVGLPNEEWDINLHAVVNEKGFLDFR